VQPFLTRASQSGNGWRLLLVVLFLLSVFAAVVPGQQHPGQTYAARCLSPENAGEGVLLYRSPVTQLYEAIPLAHTDVALDVRGLLASATVTQQYVNSSGQPIEAIYVFPLPHDATVYDMEIRVGSRFIRSAIRERAEAKRTYEAAKAEGRRAALVEQERPNIFTASVANIMPGDRIDVRLRFVQALAWQDGRIRLTFPMTIGPRYIPGTEAIGQEGTGWAADTDAVSDASRITPPVAPAGRAGHDISLAVDLDPGFETASLRSVSHEIDTRRLPDGRQHIQLAGGPTIPNRDFILEIQQAESTIPQSALFLSPDGATGETHFLLATFPPTVQPGERTPVEMLYLIDVSGSMSGTSIEQAREALLEALDRLRPGDRFDVLAFNQSFEELSPEPLAASPENLESARRYVKGLDAGGGTEMLPALLHTMRKPARPGYLRHIVLLTDGDLGNEEQIFAALRGELRNARLFTVAIGSAPNFFLASKMAQFGRGSFTHIADISEIRKQMGSLLETIESPVLTDVKLEFQGVEAGEIYPSRPPDLFLRQPLFIYGRIPRGGAGTLRLTAKDGSAPYETAIHFDTGSSSFHPGITTLWARQRIDELSDRWRTAEESARGDLRAGIVAEAIRYHLVTQFTSLVAIEQVVANPGAQSSSVAVPSELPAGMQMEKVFGAPATGTADGFLEILGVCLVLASAMLLLLTGGLKRSS
jgi:Ca-activated chloride channel homolog